MIQGLSHITLIVHDLDRMTDFLTTIFDAEQVYDSGDAHHSLSPERFFRICDVWLAIMKGDALRDKTYNHLAFKIPDAEFDAYEKRVHEYGVEVRASRSRIGGEGRSLYFHDHDNHLFELHTGTLDDRLAAYAAAVK
ncbi:FosX/FosE/FosI family fosfomycin resistance hydrolase [Pseudodesulfovibrio sediminis]|uniref:FosX/FosE/FosI family fosfomycin resistance thiol transferase n=1 Tax=Pseudodesulfovibrio sediminis TaxID=2810563 RepID=A0ABN6EUQ0_9BACT|nr:FosX/FosE/FosI family fosfomycin resistance hydrolase [Pseudodesulfovibrio sediminis]BCS88766.1 FosX/FosE/FosI family fosfomycin resistance thiol transferase [Pseudodesulfovibrio sediminis]